MTRYRVALVPGIGKSAAAVIIAEVGLDMSRFPTAGHLASPPLRGRSEAHYIDLGADHYETHANTARQRRNHVRQLQALGYKVNLEPSA